MTIWEEIAADENRGAERLVLEYGDRLFASAYRLTDSEKDAEDLVYRTFVQVIRRIGQYDGRSSFYTWMYSVMLNFRKMDLRRKGANALVFPEELPEVADETPDPAEALVRASDCAAVRAAVSGLDEAYRTIFVMFYFEEMEVAEIARLLALPVGSVKTRLFRARKLLARKLVRTFWQDGASKQKERKCGDAGRK